MAEEFKGPIEYSIGIAAERISKILNNEYGLSKRAIALLLLCEDEEIKELVKEKEPKDSFSRIIGIIEEIKQHYVSPINYELSIKRQNEVRDIVNKVVSIEKSKISFQEKLSRITMNPVTGFPILLCVLYFGLYKFVGELGAGVAVDFLERVVFERYINPFLTAFFTKLIPWNILRELFVGEYGILTLGLRYAVAIILPIVTFFFIIFSVIEDTGYLPRLAMLIDRIFKKIGLSGRAVIPMVLGFGCDTMATMVTRTLPTKRERIISTILLALAVPCSAQLGVILALLAKRPAAIFVWTVVVSCVFLFIGYLTAKILPGERPSFYMEIPPLRFPKFSNVFTKTYARVKWYFNEILPLFLLASILIWFGKMIGIFDVTINLLKNPCSGNWSAAGSSQGISFWIFQKRLWSSRPV